MAPVIWGLPLSEMKWSKFKGSYMWNNEWHLRRTKFIVYQLAMITTVVSESLGTDCISKYVDEEDFCKSQGTTQLNNEFIGMASYNIFNGIFIATIFGAGFFFDLFWPARSESEGVRVAWKVCAIISCFSCAGTAIGMTYIVSTGTAVVPNLTPQLAQQLSDNFKGYPIVYRHGGRAMASAMLLWPGLLATIGSTILLWFANNHNEKYGAEATHVREQHEHEKHDLEAGNNGAAPLTNGAANDITPQSENTGMSDGLSEPRPAHTIAPPE